MEDGFGSSTVKRVSSGERVMAFDILTGDQLFVDRMSYHFIRPGVGSGFVFRTGNIDGIARVYGDQYYIKRLVGVPGDTLEDQGIWAVPKREFDFGRRGIRGQCEAGGSLRWIPCRGSACAWDEAINQGERIFRAGRQFGEQCRWAVLGQRAGQGCRWAAVSGLLSFYPTLGAGALRGRLAAQWIMCRRGNFSGCNEIGPPSYMLAFLCGYSHGDFLICSPPLNYASL